MNQSFTVSKTQKFFEFFANEILPYEVKYSALTGDRDYERQAKVTSLFFDILKADDVCAFIELELKPHAVAYQENYFYKLVETYKDQLKDSLSTVLNGEPYIVDGILQVKKCIIFAESILDIEGVNSNVMLDINSHINSPIYNKDFERLSEELSMFVTAFNLMSDNYDSLHDDDEEYSNDVMSPKEYWLNVVTNEAWNFLSHVSYGVTNFETPRVFVSNINKGVSHLSRATLDIYDGLITFSNLVTPEYINIKVSKLTSLGESKKIQSVNESLKVYYESNLR